MSKTSLEKLNDLVEKELDQLAIKGSLSPSELDSAKKAVELMTCISEYEEMCKMKEDGESHMYSERGRIYHGRSYMYPEMYDPTYSMNRNSYNNSNWNSYDDSNSYQHRDAMGRYSGHSIKDRMIDRLERMMDESNSEYERKEIMEEISRLRQNS